MSTRDNGHNVSVTDRHQILSGFLQNNDEVQSQIREGLEQVSIDQRSKADGRAWHRVVDGSKSVQPRVERPRVWTDQSIRRMADTSTKSLAHGICRIIIGYC
jgi:hypothetical protein